MPTTASANGITDDITNRSITNPPTPPFSDVCYDTRDGGGYVARVAGWGFRDVRERTEEAEWGVENTVCEL